MVADQHTWRFFLSPPAAWEGMFNDCRQAKKSIEVEQYIFENDDVGQRFLEMFIDKAEEGISVFLICDKFGSATLYNSPLIEKLRNAGGSVYFYNIVRAYDLFRPWRWFPRTHVKSMLIDGQVAYTGGVCFAERMRGWRDTQIRITGPVVDQVQKAFAQIEKIVRHGKLAGGPKLTSNDGEFAYLQSAPLRSWHIIYRELMRAISRAQQSIFISTPFFAPNRRFRRLIRAAARKGLDVRLLVPEHSDVAMADWLALSYARGLLRAGAKIYHYQDGVLHNKTVVIDDNWATIGSTNMDVLSFFRNRESNLVTRNFAAVAELKQQFMNDLKRSTEISFPTMAREPYWKRGAGFMLRSVKSFLWRP